MIDDNELKVAEMLLSKINDLTKGQSVLFTVKQDFAKNIVDLASLSITNNIKLDNELQNKILVDFEKALRLFLKEK